MTKNSILVATLNSQAEPSVSMDLTNKLQIRIQEELNKLATILEVDPFDLQSWLDLFRQASLIEKLGALRLMMRYRLNPLYHEFTLLEFSNQEWTPYITIDGWMKLINHQPAFSGVEFLESSELLDGVPIWIECTVFRSDRPHPMTVREYFCEVATTNSAWKTIPRRMLRHRALQQAARLAFGITGTIVDGDVYSSAIEKGFDQSNTNHCQGTVSSSPKCSHSTFASHAPKSRVATLKELLSENAMQTTIC